MPVTDDLVDAFRAYLSGDMDRWDERLAALAPATSRAYFAYLSALFAAAVRRRFPGEATWAQAVRFVADLRARDERWADRLDPDAVERMILMVFDDDVKTGDIPRVQTLGIRLVVLAAIIREEALSGPELDVFLTRGRTLGDEILGDA